MRPLAIFLVWTCAILWAALAAQGVISYVTLEPTGDGFTRGLNRIFEFLRWEAFALAAALIGFVAGRGAPHGNLARFAARWPLYLSGGFFLALIILYLAAVIGARL